MLMSRLALCETARLTGLTMQVTQETIVVVSFVLQTVQRHCMSEQ